VESEPARHDVSRDLAKRAIDGEYEGAKPNEGLREADAELHGNHSGCLMNGQLHAGANLNP
jgi:hypothetical protein